MARVKKALAATAVMLVAVTACSGGDSSGSSDSEGSQSADAGPREKPGTAGAPAEAEGSEDASGATIVDTAAIQDRDIIHNVDLTVETDDVDAAATQAVSVTEGAGGYVADQSSRGDERTNLTLKIPADAHEDAVGELEQLGAVVTMNRTTEDVTDQVVDTESRIESQRSTIARTRELLETASDIDQVIRIEEELSRREADLDALLRTREELSALTSLATVEITLRTPDEDDTVTAGGFGGGLREGWSIFLGVLDYGALIIGAAAPFLAVGAVVGLPILWWRRRRTSTNEDGPTNPLGTTPAAAHATGHGEAEDGQPGASTE